MLPAPWRAASVPCTLDSCIPSILAVKEDYLYLQSLGARSCGERITPDSGVLTGPWGLLQIKDSPVFLVPSSPGGLRLVSELADEPVMGGRCFLIPLRSRRTVSVVHVPPPLPL